MTIKLLINIGNWEHLKEKILKWLKTKLVMKTCPDVDIKESEFMEVFKLTDNYMISGDILNLNVGRRALLAVFKAVYF